MGHEREGEVVTEVAVEAHERRKDHDPAQVTECIVTCMPETSPKAREAVSSMMMNGHPKTLEGNPDKYVCDKSVSNVWILIFDDCYIILNYFGTLLVCKKLENLLVSLMSCNSNSLDWAKFDFFHL